MLSTGSFTQRSAIVLSLFAASVAAGQSTARTRNNPYSPSPERTTAGPAASQPTPAQPQDVAFAMQPRQAFKEKIEVRTPDADAGRASLPNNIYRVGIGDVLAIKLKNVPQGSASYTVREDGTIDYPLAGDDVPVAGKTPDEIRTMLARSIKLFSDPQPEVKVREYYSHKVTIEGAVQNGGERCLQREAVPLFVIKADAVVDAKATRVLITRGPALPVESYSLRDAATDNIVVNAGNKIEFVVDVEPATFFITGKAAGTGKKKLEPGTTLYRAVAAAGNVKSKKASIRRKNDKGEMISTEYSLKPIREGKVQDPALAAGDIVEIIN